MCKLKLHIMDTIGVMIRGSLEPILIEESKNIDDVSLSVQEATNIVNGRKTSLLHAAYINSLSAHILLFDDEHNQSVLHPGCVIIPTLLAVAEKNNFSGMDFLLGAAVSYESAIRLAMTLSPFHYNLGFSPTGTVNSIGATIGLAKMSSYSLEKTKVAIAIAAQEMAGTRIYQSGGHTKYAMFLAGNASLNSIFSWKSAIDKLEPYNVLDNASSIFYTAFKRSDTKDNDYFSDYGKKWYISEMKFKIYPSSRFCHGAVSYLLSLFKNKQINYMNVESIEIGLDKNRYLISNIQNVDNVDQAIFSIQFNIAASLIFGKLTLDEFKETIIKDKRIKSLIKKIRPYEAKESNAEYPGRWLTYIRIKLTDGKIIEDDFDALTIDDDEQDRIKKKYTENIIAKYDSNKAEELLNKIMHLEDVNNVNDLMARFST